MTRGTRRPDDRRTVAIMQPYFLPYAGYFRLLAESHVFVVLDTVQFRKGGRIHRTQIPGPAGGVEWLTLPLAPHPIETPISNVRFAVDARERFDVRLERAPWLATQTGTLADELRAYLQAPLDAFLEYLEWGIRIVARGMAITTPIVRASQVDIDRSLRGQSRVLALCRALGAEIYLNAPGGAGLYDAAAFRDHGIDLRFLPPYDGPHTAMLWSASSSNDPRALLH